MESITLEGASHDLFADLMIVCKARGLRLNLVGYCLEIDPGMKDTDEVLSRLLDELPEIDHCRIGLKSVSKEPLFAQ